MHAHVIETYEDERPVTAEKRELKKKSDAVLPWHARDASTFSTVSGKVPLTLPAERSNWKSKSNNTLYPLANSEILCAAEVGKVEKTSANSLQSALGDTPDVG